ncbi:Hypothetical protein POVN_LOCUS278 [uncultured virus]|nr:Hypothetical protein POVN_LOCUS278 [uncultured virus]
MTQDPLAILKIFIKRMEDAKESQDEAEIDALSGWVAQGGVGSTTKHLLEVLESYRVPEEKTTVHLEMIDPDGVVGSITVDSKDTYATAHQRIVKELDLVDESHLTGVHFWPIGFEKHVPMGADETNFLQTWKRVNAHALLLGFKTLELPIQYPEFKQTVQVVVTEMTTGEELESAYKKKRKVGCAFLFVGDKALDSRDRVYASYEAYRKEVGLQGPPVNLSIRLL